MYQEDKPEWAIFHYLKDGFRYPPCFHYGRPFWIKYYRTRSGPDKCHLSEPTFKTWLDQIELFVNAMNTKQNRDQPYFSFNFLTEYTHDYLALPDSFDASFAQMLDRLDTKGFLDNTMLIFFSDHGHRLKYYSYGTEIGRAERNLPFLIIKPPKQLEKSGGGDLIKNLDLNRRKLVSFFDVYQTLKHFFYLNKYSTNSVPLDTQRQCNKEFFGKNSKHVRTERGISLFDTVPLNRSCPDALISIRNCACLMAEKLDEKSFLAETSETFESAGQLVLDKIDALLSRLGRDRCERFHIERVVSVKRQLTKNNPFTPFKIYKIIVLAQPGAAWFEADLIASNNKNNRRRQAHSSTLRVHGEIVRLSAYGNQSSCVKDSYLVNYCFCKTSAQLVKS